MKKLSLLLLLLLALGVSCNKAVVTPSAAPDNQNTQANSNLVAYTNTKYGFEFQRPSDWTSGTGDPILFTFQTHQGYTAQFGLDQFMPYNFDEGRKTAIENSKPTRAKSVIIGGEYGLIDDGIVCSPSDHSCAANINFFSNQLTTKGFSFYVTIPNLSSQDAEAIKNDNSDPYLFFPQEMTKVEQVLYTFKFTKSDSSGGAVTLKRVCPEAWYDDQMPGATDGQPSGGREYLVVNGHNENPQDYDLKWIQANCSINKPEVVY